MCTVECVTYEQLKRGHHCLNSPNTPKTYTLKYKYNLVTGDGIPRG